MDLIFWRHAEAEDAAPGQEDLERALTPRGEKHAKRMAGWLDQRLPESTRIICSPARRCEQTVQPLGRKYKLRDELAPQTTVDAMLAVAGWPGARSSVLLVGHQPLIGAAVAMLMGVKYPSLPIRKGAVWWIRARERDHDLQSVLLAVQSPELL